MSIKVPLVELHSYVPRAPFKFAQPLNITLNKGEIWLVYGLNGSGKSIFANVLMKSYQCNGGEIHHNLPGNDWNRVTSNIAHLCFNSQYGGSEEGMCYQMRWNQGLLDDSHPRVRDVLKFPEDSDVHNKLLKLLKLDTLLNEYIISLSSGEFRRFQIAQMLAKGAQIFIIENPFIGLDVENRRIVADFLKDLVERAGIQLILQECRVPEDLELYTHLIRIREGRVEKLPMTPELRRELSAEENYSWQQMINNSPSDKPQGKEDEDLLRLEKVSIKYGTRTILKDLDWSMKRGEKWALRGENGAGKSTLLSLICADNPQGYRCNITLFGRKRGTGESIWDIKRNIGYVSPEMYKSYRRPLPVENIVASGLFDTIGLYVQPKEEHLKQVAEWMRLFNLEQFRGMNYLHLSDGWQRMVLLARAFVKNPPLLILDEPFHGLDNVNRRIARSIIERWCGDPSKSLIMVSHYAEDFPAAITHQLVLHKNI